MRHKIHKTIQNKTTVFIAYILSICMEMTETSTKPQQEEEQQEEEYECIASCQALYDLSQNDDKQKKMVETLPDMIHKAISDILKMNTTTIHTQEEEDSPLSIPNAIQSLHSIFYSIHILIDLLHPMFHHPHLFHDPTTGNADGHKKKKKEEKE